MKKYSRNAMGYNDLQIMIDHMVSNAVWDAIDGVQKKSRVTILSKDKMTLRKSDIIEKAITKISDIVFKLVLSK